MCRSELKIKIQTIFFIVSTDKEAKFGSIEPVEVLWQSRALSVSTVDKEAKFGTIEPVEVFCQEH